MAEPRPLRLPHPRRATRRAAAALRCAGADAALGEGCGECGEVRLAERLGGDRPDVALVAATADLNRMPNPRPEKVGTSSISASTNITSTDRTEAPFVHSILPYRIGIVKVSGALAQQKHMLMGCRWPVRHALRHRVGLGPDDIRPDPPAVRLQRQRKPCGHQQ